MEEPKCPKITKDTPIEEVKQIHQRIWDYIVEHGRKPDNAIFSYMFGCAACEYARWNTDVYGVIDLVDDFGNLYRAHGFCYACPIKWPDNQRCSCPDSIFTKWNHEDIKSPIKNDFAKFIRDVPWKFEETEDEN